MADEVVDPSRLEAAQQYIQQEEGQGPRHPLRGSIGKLASAIAVGMSLLFLYWAWATVTAQVLRLMFLVLALVLTFLIYPARRRAIHYSVPWYDWFLILASIAVVAYPLWDFEEFIYRAALPTTQDQLFGALTIVLVLEATRRTTGWILPAVAIAFLGYAWLGAYLPPPWTHQGYGLDRLVGHMYVTLEGIFGVPLDVAATFIILFTIYGAVLEFSKAGEFYVNFSLAATGGKPAAAGRTVTLASFLLGGPSGSGVATTVTLSSVSWPLLAKAGYDKESAGGLLAAGGIGAIISPPVLGAAAFLIAEFLRISYLDVLAMAAIPTILYYWSIFMMVSLDARKFGAKPIRIEGETAWSLTRKYGYHFISLVAIVAFMMWGYTAILSVAYAILLGVALSYIRRDSALTPARLWRMLEKGSTDVLSVASTCATAGIIVGVVDSHRSRSKIFAHHSHPGGQQSFSHGSLHRAGAMGPRPGCAGHRVLHYRRCNHRAGDDQARHTRICRPYVYFLLRGAFGGLAADGARAVCRRCDYGRQSLQDDDDGLEVYRPGIFGTVHVHAASRRHRAAPKGPLGQYSLDGVYRVGRPQ